MNLKEWCTLHNAQELLACYLGGDNPLPPDKIGFSSGKKVRWKCPVCLSEWTLAPNHMNRRRPGRTVCPYCSHERPSHFYNLALLYPELVSYWDDEKNPIPMDQAMPGSRKRAAWHCHRGHTWHSPICDQVAAVERRRRVNWTDPQELCPVCRKPLSLAEAFPELLPQWDYEQNGGLTPWDITPYNSQTVHWVCAFNPVHRWTDRVGNRTILLRGCPICSRRFHVSYAARTLYYYLCREGIQCELEKVAGRYRIDIAVLPPQGGPVALELDGYVTHRSDKARDRDACKDMFLRNAGYRVIRIREDSDLTDEILFANNVITYPQSDRHLWLDTMVVQVFSWLLGRSIQPDHRKDHWEIEALFDRFRKEKSLAAAHPELAIQWSARNEDPPDTIPPGSNRLFWWECPVCRRSYQSSPSNRIRQGCGCPYCSNRIIIPENSLKERFPEVAEEWNYPKNAPLIPEEVAPSSGKRVWWICAQGHEWQTAIFLRTRGKRTKCPVCQIGKPAPDQSLAVRRPAIAADWDAKRNLPFRPVDVGPRSNRLVWWMCPNGHLLRSTVRKRCGSKGCPLCTPPSRPSPSH